MQNKKLEAWDLDEMSDDHIRVLLWELLVHLKLDVYWTETFNEFGNTDYIHVRFENQV